jgi:PAS domain S-box-containing protein
VVVWGGVTLFMALASPSVYHAFAHRTLEDKAWSLARVAASGLAAEGILDNPTHLEEHLGGLLTDPDVRRISLTDASGRIILSLAADEQFPDAQERESGSPHADGLLTAEVEFPAGPGGREFGTLEVVVSSEQIRAEAGQVLRLALVGSMVVFIFGAGLVLLVSMRLIGPLNKIARAAERIAKGDLSERAPASTGEMDRLARSFNRMIDRLQASQARLQMSNVQLERILDNLPSEVALFDLQRRYLYISPMGLGDDRTRKLVLGMQAPEYWSFHGYESDVGEEVDRAIARCIAEKRLVTTEQTIRDQDGRSRHFIRAFSPVLGDAGEPVQVVGYAVDVSDQKEAEEALRATEEQLRQAQRMDSIGRLAGGIAHDFNNLLTLILGHCDLILMDVEAADPIREDIEEVQTAAERASSLIRQLLAFSRKDVLQPKVLSLNDVIRDTESMLRRLIGEHIELRTNLSPHIHDVMADPAHIEQVIVNLVVNSRDAMKRGGVLTIGTGNADFDDLPESVQAVVGPGSFAWLQVTDTGTGMDAETLEHIFDPFFTTKDVGQGTGLGLATVYGIVNQNRGAIDVRSQVGEGTAFQVFLPVHERPAQAALETGSITSSGEGALTVLVVDDQEAVCELARRSLELAGYEVLVETGAEGALSLAEEHEGPIHLLLSDVVMPGMTGPELARRLCQLKPQATVLYMSGYTGEALARQGVSAEEIELIPKPFTPDQLAKAVKGVLGSRAQGLPGKVRPRGRLWPSLSRRSRLRSPMT